jgi:hypothetical protein
MDTAITPLNEYWLTVVDSSINQDGSSAVKLYLNLRNQTPLPNTAAKRQAAAWKLPAFQELSLNPNNYRICLNTEIP